MIWTCTTLSAHPYSLWCKVIGGSVWRLCPAAFGIRMPGQGASTEKFRHYWRGISAQTVCVARINYCVEGSKLVNGKCTFVCLGGKDSPVVCVRTVGPVMMFLGRQVGLWVKLRRAWAASPNHWHRHCLRTDISAEYHIELSPMSSYSLPTSIQR